MNRMFVFTILGVAAVSGLSVAAAQRDGAQPQPTRSRSTKAASVGDEIELDLCRIKLKDHALLAADRPGILATITKKEGERVRKNDPVALLKADVARAAWEVATKKANDRTEIEYAKKAAKQSELEVKKAKEVNAEQAGTISAIEIQRLILQWEKDKASIQKAEMQKEILTKQAEEAKAQLDTFTVTAPFDGWVKTKLKSVGEAVRQGDPIIEIVNTEVVLVEGYIDYRDRPRIKVGNMVDVQLQDEDAEDGTYRLHGARYPGKIVFIDRIAQARTQEVLVKAEVRNTRGILYPGLTTRMTIKPGTQYNASTAPTKR